MDANDICKEFASVIYGIWGSYLDATVALERQALEMEIRQRETIKQLQHENPSIASMAYMDARMLGYGDGPPTTHPVLHQKTQGEFKALNRKGGENHVLIGNLFLAAVYNYWEDHYRKAIADALGRSKNEIGSDLFGDLRYLRHAIIHNRGIADEDVTRLKVLVLQQESID